MTLLRHELERIAALAEQLPDTPTVDAPPRCDLCDSSWGAAPRSVNSAPMSRSVRSVGGRSSLPLPCPGAADAKPWSGPKGLPYDRHRLRLVRPHDRSPEGSGRNRGDPLRRAPIVGQDDHPTRVRRPDRRRYPRDPRLRERIQRRRWWIRCRSGQRHTALLYTPVGYTGAIYMAVDTGVSGSALATAVSYIAGASSVLTPARTGDYAEVRGGPDCRSRDGHVPLAVRIHRVPRQRLSAADHPPVAEGRRLPVPWKR